MEPRAEGCRDGVPSKSVLLPLQLFPRSSFAVDALLCQLTLVDQTACRGGDASPGNSRYLHIIAKGASALTTSLLLAAEMI